MNKFKENFVNHKIMITEGILITFYIIVVHV